MSKIGYFQYVKKKSTSSIIQLTFNKKIETLWLMIAVTSRALILRQLIFKKSQSTHTFHNERKKVFEPTFVLEAKGKTKSNHEVLGLWQRSLRLHDVIDF